MDASQDRGSRASRRAAIATACLLAAAGLMAAGVTAHSAFRAPRGTASAALLDDSLSSGVSTDYPTDSWGGELKSTSWSGYVVTGPEASAAATFTVPALPSCQNGLGSRILGGPAEAGVIAAAGSRGPATDFWAGIQTTDSSGTSIVQDGIAAACPSNGPDYYAWMVTNAYNGIPVPLPGTVQAGDLITAAVFTDLAGHYTLAVYDWSENWSQTSTLTGSAGSNDMAAVASESFSGGVSFAPVAVTGAYVNGEPIGQSNPEAEEEAPALFGGVVALDPTPLDQTEQNFSFYWNL